MDSTSGSVVACLEVSPVSFQTWHKLRGETNIHVQHVRQNVITQLLAGHSGQLVGDGILTLASDQLGMLLRIHARRREIVVRFHEEGIARLVAGGRTLLVGHGVESGDKHKQQISIPLLLKSVPDENRVLSGNDGIKRVTVVNELVWE